MALRVTSEFWVAALLRRVQAGAAFATVANRGEASAGAIFVVIDNMMGQASLMGPAPQALYDDERQGIRYFEWLLENVEPEQVRQRLAREKSFDPDIWIVEIEDRAMRSFIDDMA